MDKTEFSQIPLCQNWTNEISLPPDGEITILHCTYGFRAISREEDLWHIEPILQKGAPVATGFMRKEHLQRFLNQNGFTPIAFHKFGWSRGNYFSRWCPIIPSQSNHMLRPADLWSNIASKFFLKRVPDEIGQIDIKAVSELFDEKGEVERLAQSISLSLRNMDLSIEQITIFYNEQLVNLMRSGNVTGEKIQTSLDQTLFAYVHAFFIHLGTARDYLASLIALRLNLTSQSSRRKGQKIDSFANLLNVLRSDEVAQDDLAKLLLSKGIIELNPSNKINFRIAGWLKEASDLRNKFTHQRPYGGKFVERMGFAQPVAQNLGIYRYNRPISTGEKEPDVLELITKYYIAAGELFLAASRKTGYDSDIITITDKDIILENIIEP